MTQTNSKKRRRLFRTAAIFAGLLPFVVLELFLVIFDIGNPQSHVDPFVGFSKIHPLFELQDDGESYQTSKSREINFGRQSFAAHKPEDAFRAFCLGGSTVRGRPFQVDTAFARWAELELNLRDQRAQYEFINCGGLSYASYRLLPILDEVLQYDPDLIVIATGHNEFLEDRTYRTIKSQSSATRWLIEQAYSLRTVTLARGVIHDAGKTQERTILPDDVDPKLDSESGYASYRRDEQWKANVAEHFRQSLTTMIDRCRQANVPVVSVRLGMNLRDCPPFKSELNDDIEVADQRQFVAAMESAKDQEAESAEAALATYRKAELIDPHHPLLCYRIARCLDRIGQYDDAAKYYLKAKDLDICPLRMTETVSQNLIDVAQLTQTPLVDARANIHAAAESQIPGQDWFVDHVHPSIRGHQRIASLLVDKLKTESIVTLNALSDETRRQAFSQHLESLGPNYRANGGRRVGWLEHWARRTKLFEDTLPQTSRGFLVQGHKQLGFGDESGAVGAYKMAQRLDDSFVDTLIPEVRTLYQDGQLHLALTLIQTLKNFDLSSQQAAEVTAAEIVLLVSLKKTDRAQRIFDQQHEVIELKKMSSSIWLDDYLKVTKSLTNPSSGA